jgi:hypothetical protein
LGTCHQADLSLWFTPKRACSCVLVVVY